MNNGKVKWEGHFVAAITPFSESGDLNEAAFRKNLSLLVSEGVHGVVVSGCTGEAWALQPEERIRLVRLAVDTVGPKIPVIAGTGGISTEGVIELSLSTKEAGAAGIMVLPPYYCMLGRREVVAHYRAISDAVKHPILLYNIPRRVGFNMTPEVVEELASLEWVVAIKESSGDFIQVEATIQRVGEAITVLTGHSAERAVPALLMGAQGYVSSLESQVMGKDAIEMYALFKRGELHRAREVQLRTLALDEALRGTGTFPANLKAAMNLLGRPGGHPRPPLLPLSESEVGRVRSVLEDLKLAPAVV
jgi:4-hydroxy-tetrahydrodipicolinate synthase